MANTRPGRGSRLRAIVRVVFAAFGAAVLIALVRSAGTDAVTSCLARVAPWLPLVLTLEAIRMGLELVATRARLGPAVSRVKPLELVRIQLIAYGVSIVAPAGRPASEATKATLLAPHVGASRAAAVAAGNQVSSLTADASLSLIGLFGLFLLGAGSYLLGGLAVHFVVCAGAAVLVNVAVRSARLERLLARFPRVSAAVADLGRAARDEPFMPPVPTVAFVASKALTVVMMCLLLHAAGVLVSVRTAFVTLGLNSLAAAIGDMVPAQIGTTDGVFALGAAELAAPAALLLGVTTTFHLVQLAWVAVSAFVPLVWQTRDESGSELEVAPNLP